VKVTRLAFGTGSFSGQVQRDLGQEGFTRLVRYAYDHGIRFFETAESYTNMHAMLGVALKGIPRDSYRLMSKVTTRDGGIRKRSLMSCASSRIRILRRDASSRRMASDVPGMLPVQDASREAIRIRELAQLIKLLLRIPPSRVVTFDISR